MALRFSSALHLLVAAFIFSGLVRAESTFFANAKERLDKATRNENDSAKLTEFRNKANELKSTKSVAEELNKLKDAYQGKDPQNSAADNGKAPMTHGGGEKKDGLSEEEKSKADDDLLLYAVLQERMERAISEEAAKITEETAKALDETNKRQEAAASEAKNQNPATDPLANAAGKMQNAAKALGNTISEGVAKTAQSLLNGTSATLDSYAKASLNQAMLDLEKSKSDLSAVSTTGKATQRYETTVSNFTSGADFKTAAEELKGQVKSNERRLSKASTDLSTLQSQSLIATKNAGSDPSGWSAVTAKIAEVAVAKKQVEVARLEQKSAQLSDKQQLLQMGLKDFEDREVEKASNKVASETKQFNEEVKTKDGKSVLEELAKLKEEHTNVNSKADAAGNFEQRMASVEKDSLAAKIASLEQRRDELVKNPPGSEKSPSEASGKSWAGGLMDALKDKAVETGKALKDVGQAALDSLSQTPEARTASLKERVKNQIARETEKEIKNLPDTLVGLTKRQVELQTESKDTKEKLELLQKEREQMIAQQSAAKGLAENLAKGSNWLLGSTNSNPTEEGRKAAAKFDSDLRVNDVATQRVQMEKQGQEKTMSAIDAKLGQITANAFKSGPELLGQAFKEVVEVDKLIKDAKAAVPTERKQQPEQRQAPPNEKSEQDARHLAGINNKLDMNTKVQDFDKNKREEQIAALKGALEIPDQSPERRAELEKRRLELLAVDAGIYRFGLNGLSASAAPIFGERVDASKVVEGGVVIQVNPDGSHKLMMKVGAELKETTGTLHVDYRSHPDGKTNDAATGNILRGITHDAQGKIVFETMKTENFGGKGVNYAGYDGFDGQSGWKASKATTEVFEVKSDKVSQKFEIRYDNIQYTDKGAQFTSVAVPGPVTVRQEPVLNKTTSSSSSPTSVSVPANKVVAKSTPAYVAQGAPQYTPSSEPPKLDNAQAGASMNALADYWTKESLAIEKSRKTAASLLAPEIPTMTLAQFRDLQKRVEQDLAIEPWQDLKGRSEPGNAPYAYPVAKRATQVYVVATPTGTYRIINDNGTNLGPRDLPSQESADRIPEAVNYTTSNQPYVVRRMGYSVRLNTPGAIHLSRQYAPQPLNQ